VIISVLRLKYARKSVSWITIYRLIMFLFPSTSLERSNCECATPYLKESIRDVQAMKGGFQPNHSPCFQEVPRLRRDVHIIMSLSYAIPKSITVIEKVFIVNGSSMTRRPRPNWKPLIPQPPQRPPFLRHKMIALSVIFSSLRKLVDYLGPATRFPGGFVEWPVDPIEYVDNFRLGGAF